MDRVDSENIGFVIKTIWGACSSLAVGVISKYATEIRKGRDLPLLGWVAIGAMSVTTGVFFGWLAQMHGISGYRLDVIKCASAMLGENILLFVSLKANSLIRKHLINIMTSITEILKSKDKK